MCINNAKTTGTIGFCLVWWWIKSNQKFWWLEWSKHVHDSISIFCAIKIESIIVMLLQLAYDLNKRVYFCGDYSDFAVIDTANVRISSITQHQWQDDKTSFRVGEQNTDCKGQQLCVPEASLIGLLPLDSLEEVIAVFRSIFQWKLVHNSSLLYVSSYVELFVCFIYLLLLRLQHNWCVYLLISIFLTPEKRETLYVFV